MKENLELLHKFKNKAMQASRGCRTAGRRRPPPHVSLIRIPALGIQDEGCLNQVYNLMDACSFDVVGIGLN